MSANYVKFLRGSEKAFKNLNYKDDDTLYFIADENGKINLYLGDDLISSGISSDLTLSDLKDMSFETALASNDILIYNGVQWNNTPVSNLKTLLNIPGVMTGASETITGMSGLVPVPTAGSHNKFLRGDGSWVNIQENFSNAINDLIDGASDEFKTLKKIESQIINTNVGVEKLEKRVSSLENSIGGGTVNLNDYVSKIEFNSVVGILNDWNSETKIFNDLKTEEKSSIVGAINELYNHLAWGDINAEV